MKKHLLNLIAILASTLVYGQVENCAQFRTGVFQFPGANGGVYTVIRTDSSQLERNSMQAQHSKMKIKWGSDCAYTLYDRVEYKWGKQALGDTEIMEIRNILYRFEQPNKFHVKTYVPGYPDTVETIFTKLDTTRTYNNLFQLGEFAEYKNSKAYGQTLLGEIHSIDYYESNQAPNKYLIVFETSYHGEFLNRSRLLDTLTLTLKPAEQITNSDCRFKGEFDDEVVAVYASRDAEKEAKIVRAFRCNRRSEKIEELDISKVQYREADRNRIKW